MQWWIEDIVGRQEGVAMIKTLNDVFDYIENHFGRKLSEMEKHNIRVRMLVGEKAHEILESVGIDSSKVEIQ